jgi:hypothetical protein
MQRAYKNQSTEKYSVPPVGVFANVRGVFLCIERIQLLCEYVLERARGIRALIGESNDGWLNHGLVVPCAIPVQTSDNGPELLVSQGALGVSV